MSVDNIQKSDFAPWAALWREYQATVHGRAQFTEDQVQDTFSRLLDNDEPVHALVVRDDETCSVLGFIHFSPLATCTSRKPICWVLDLLVDEAFRGKGYGRKLLEATMQKAKEMGCRQMSWITNEENATARALYESIVPRAGVAYYRLRFDESLQLDVPDEQAPVVEDVRSPQMSD